MKMLVGFTLLLTLQIAGEATARLFTLPVPGPVIGLAYLWLGLSLIPSLEELMEQACSTLLSHLSLLFIPAGVGVISQLHLLNDSWLAVASIILVSTVAGLCVTALVMQSVGRHDVRLRHNSDET